MATKRDDSTNLAYLSPFKREIETFARQQQRISELQSYSSAEGGKKPSAAAAKRAHSALEMLWSLAKLRPLLFSTFITSTGDGHFQFEWQHEGRYFEVEIPSAGSFELLSQDASGSREVAVQTAGDVANAFELFWQL